MSPASDPLPVVFLSMSAQATEAGGRTRILSEIRSVRGPDVRVLLLCGVPLRQLLRGSLRSARRRLARDAEVETRYLPMLPFRRVAGVRAIGDRLAALAVRRVCRRTRARIVHAHGQHAAEIALLARSSRARFKVVADIHGIAPEEHAYASRNGRIHAWLERRERRVLAESNWLVYVSHRMDEHYRRKYGLSAEKATVVPCVTEAGFELDPGRRARVRRELGLEDRAVFCYLGTYRRYQQVEETFALFRDLADRLPEARLLVVTPDRARIAAELAGAGVGPERYRLLSLPHDRVLETLAAADFGFLLRADSPVNHVASPTKFAEYCLAGLPVITTPHVGDYSGTVARHGLGFVTDPPRTDLEDLLAFVRHVLSERERYAARCHHFARERLSWTTYGPRLRAVYDALRPGPDDR